MAREEVRVSLFPFMSVLACTIGALILLLTSLALSAVTPPDRAARTALPAAEDERASDTRLAPTVESPQRSEAPAPPAPASAEAIGMARVETLFARVDRLLSEREGAPQHPRLDLLESRLARERQDEKLVADLAALEAAAAAFAREGETVEADVAALESRRETLPILIDPTGLSRALEPWFIECDGRGITLHRATDDFRHFEPREEISSGGELGRYLRRLRAMPGALLVLLLRADGIDTAKQTAAVAVALGVRVASLPLPGRGELDWSLLRRAERNQAKRGGARE